MSTNRRQILKFAGFGLSGIASAPFTGTRNIVSVITPGPKAPDEKTDTARLQRTIDQAHENGGGIVHLPPGQYVSGTLTLRTNVSLWLDNGCVLTMSTDLEEFHPPEKPAFNTGANLATSDFHFALLAGEGVEHIAVFGEGVIECDPHILHAPPAKPIALKRCTHISLRGITIRNARNYNISMLGCQFIEIDGITILGGHSDGIDPDCCRYLRITNCFVESVDDSLCLKASGALGGHGVCEYVTVTNCILRTASIHFKCGTESMGDFRNITISNCVFEGGVGMRHGNPGLAFYTVDGGALDNIVASGIVMRDVGTPIAIIRGNRDRGATSKGPGPLSSIRISNITATGAKLPSVVAGLPESPVNNIEFSNISIHRTASADADPRSVNHIPEKPTAYPEPVMFGKLPASGLFIRHARDIRLRDVQFDVMSDDLLPDIVADDVSGLRIYGFEKRNAAAASHLWVNNVRDSWLECLAVLPAPAQCYRVSGEKTANLFLEAKGLLHRKEHWLVETNVPHGAVHVVSTPF